MRRVPFNTSLLSIVSIVSNGDPTCNVTFSAPVSIDTGVTPDGALHIADAIPQSVAVVSPTVVLIDFAGGDETGNPWNLDSQPNWLLTPVIFPATGTVS